MSNQNKTHIEMDDDGIAISATNQRKASKHSLNETVNERKILGNSNAVNTAKIKPPKMAKKTDDLAVNTDVAKVSDADRLAFFGGDLEMFAYYKELRSSLSEARVRGVECVCDPGDNVMCRRVEREGWRPQVTVVDVLDVGGDGDVHAGNSGNNKEGVGGSRRGFSSKQLALDGDVSTNAEEEDDVEEGVKEDSTTQTKRESFVCGVQNCKAQFTSLADYESHYHTSHSFVCHACRRTFVSNFLLDIHLEENHDSYFQVLSPRIDMYRCLVESCAAKFRTPDLRKEHLVSTHKYPASFSFHQPLKQKITKTAHEKVSGQVNSKGNKNKGKTRTITNMESSDEPTLEVSDTTSLSVVEMDVEEQKCGRGRGGKRGGAPHIRGRGHQNKGVKNKSTPTSVCFGRGSQRAFQHRGRGRHWHQSGQPAGKDTTVDIDQMDFGDLADALA